MRIAKLPEWFVFLIARTEHVVVLLEPVSFGLRFGSIPCGVVDWHLSDSPFASVSLLNATRPKGEGDWGKRREGDRLNKHRIYLRHRGSFHFEQFGLSSGLL